MGFGVPQTIGLAHRSVFHRGRFCSRVGRAVADDQGAEISSAAVATVVDISEAELVERTFSTLDWPRVLEALEDEATTTRGKHNANTLELASSQGEAVNQYAAVREAGTVLDELPPLGSAMDIEDEIGVRF